MVTDDPATTVAGVALKDTRVSGEPEALTVGTKLKVAAPSVTTTATGNAYLKRHRASRSLPFPRRGKL
jgi:hypothetical protein